MPSFIELPNETLYTIVDNVHPDDIINFSLCCTRIRLLAKNAVSLHLQRKETFHNGYLVLNGCYRHWNDSHPLRLIRDICMDWRVGEYPKHLMFSCCHYPIKGSNLSPEEESEIEMDTKEWRFEKKQDSEFINKTMGVIQGYIEEKGLEFGFDVRGWLSHVMNGDRAVMLALLFLFIPRLDILCLQEFTQDAMRLNSAIRSMPEQPGAKRFLMNLTEVRLMGAVENGQGEEFRSFMTFAALPSMRKVSGKLVQGFSEPRLELTNPSNTSNITEISLQNMELQKIVAALLRHAKHSLEYLQIIGRCEEDDDIDSRRLQSFEVLKDIRLSLPLYVELLLHREGSPENRVDRALVQPLVYALPLSIESVTLVGPVFDHASTLLSDFAEEKNVRLPKLKKIDLVDRGSECDEGWAKPLEEMCENMRVTLKKNFARLVLTLSQRASVGRSGIGGLA